MVQFDIDHPLVREVIEKYLRLIVPAAVQKPGLFSFCLTNEPNFSASGRTEYSRPLWIEFLKKRHGSIDALNKLYGSSYGGFEEVPVPSIGMPEKLEAQRRYYDWVIFNQQHFAEWHRWMNGIVKSLAPQVPTSAKIMADVFNRETLARGVDPELFCGITDLAGNDCWAYPDSVGEYAYKWQVEEMWYDLLYSFRGQPVFDSENHFIRDNSPPDSIPSDSTRCILWQGALHHQAASALWVWNEPVNNDLAGSIYLRPLNIYAAGTAMLDLNRLAGEVAEASRQKGHVALLYSMTSIFWQKDYPDAVAAAYAGLNFSGEPITFLSEMQLAQNVRSSANQDVRCLILPRATHVKAETVAALLEFIKKGGSVIALGDDNLQYDEYARKRALPDELARIPHMNWTGKKGAEWAVDLRKALSENGFPVTVLSDTEGLPVWGVEYRIIPDKKRTLISLTNLTSSVQEVSLPLPGSATNLLDGRAVDPKKISLLPMVPLLLQVKPS